MSNIHMNPTTTASRWSSSSSKFPPSISHTSEFLISSLSYRPWVSKYRVLIYWWLQNGRRIKLVCCTCRAKLSTYELSNWLAIGWVACFTDFWISCWCDSQLRCETSLMEPNVTRTPLRPWILFHSFFYFEYPIYLLHSNPRHKFMFNFIYAYY